MADDQTIEELTRAVQALNQTIAQGKTIDPKEVEKVNRALMNASKSSKAQSDAEKLQTAEVNKGAKGVGRFAGSVSNLARRSADLAVRFGEAASDIRENRESFTSLNPAIKLTGDTIKKAGSLTGGVVDALGDALSSIPVVGGAIGGLVSAAGKITAALAEAAGNIINTVGPMLTAELERASKAYRQAGQVGALGADGLRGLANQAIDAGLSFSTFAGVINKTAPDLVFALGNSADAAKTLASTSKEMVPFRRGLLALGVTVEQQNELTAGYIGLQQRLGRNEARDARSLAQGSQNYIKNLTELSKLTGRSVSEQQKELDDQMRNVRASAALRQVQAKLGGTAGKDAVENIQGVTSVLKERAPAIAAGFADALGDNLGTDAAKNFQQATGAAGMQIIAQLKAGQIDRDTALMKLQEAGAARYQSMGGDKFAMAVGGMGTALEPVILDLQNLTFGAKFGEQIGKVSKQVDQTAKTTDGVTNSMINAQESMIKAGKALDELALQTTLPAAAAGIETFTKGMVEGTQSLMKYVGKTKEEIAKMLRQEAGLGKETVEKGDVALTSGLGAGGGAAIGATIGSFILPGIGTAIGGGIGALVGLIAGNAAGKEGVGQDMVDFDDDSWFGELFTKKPANKAKKKNAMGGPVNKDELYMVGEQGPELMIPDTAGMIMPNNQLPTLSPGIGAMAGPAGGIAGGMGDTTSFFNSLGESATPAIETGAAAGGGMQNALGEAQLARLDMLINETSRANQINTKILQAARS
tara:strand:- start:6337 stop:8607 length:2271 start_codon:yes stop_codon:yes gene_type:complete